MTVPDTAIAGATITLLPNHRQTISAFDGYYRFDSIQPGTYQLLIERSNLAYDTTQSFTVATGDSTVFDAVVQSVLWNWRSVVVFQDGTYVDGPLILFPDGSSAVSYDHVSFVYGTWSLVHDTVRMSNSGWNYTGIVASDSKISGYVQFPTERSQWTATR